MYQLKLTKKYITISPIPNKTIPYAIKAELNKNYDYTSTNVITADLLEGKFKYSLPTLPKGVRIVKVYIKEDGKR